MQYFKILSLLILLQACNNEAIIKDQPLTLMENTSFDLILADFNESVPLLYAKLQKKEDIYIGDSIDEGDNKYRITNLITDFMELTVPQKELGYIFNSHEIDSVVNFGDIYFNSLKTLTNTDKKAIAFYTSTEYDSLQKQNKALDYFKKIYGEPKYAFKISSDYNQNSYEWILNDRTIQISTSTGWGATFGGDGEFSNNKYYIFELLIIENTYKEQIHAAHIYEFPDKIMYDGKMHSYKDFQFEKISLFSDEFLLNSTNEELVKNEYGIYSIDDENEEK